VSHRGYPNSILEFDDCRLPDAQVLGAVDAGFDIVNTWLYATRLTVAAMAVGRARRCFDHALSWAAERRQFGQQIAKFQGVSFQIADMITEIDAADWLTLAAAWRLDQGLPANREIASAKLYATEMLARVTDATLQIHGGMGLMDDLPWSASGATRGWSASGTGRARSSATSSAATSSGRSGREGGTALPPPPPPLHRRGGRGRVGREHRAGMRADRLRGPVWPVHPAKAEVGGRAAVPRIADLPGAPDAVFVGVNREATVEAVAELAAAGAGGAVCFAAGFREAAAELGDGAALQDRLVAAAGDMRILGPNCYGFLNYLDGAALWPDQHGGQREARGVAIVTQSSNIAINLTMQRRGLPVAYVVTAGNQAQTGLSEIGAALLEDPRVTALGLHVEGIDDLSAFVRMAESARVSASGSWR
jgi:hypothetical protein